MRLEDTKHNSFIEVKVNDGLFAMSAQVRLKSLLEMYAISLVLIILKIYAWKRLVAWWKQRKKQRKKHNGTT